MDLASTNRAAVLDGDDALAISALQNLMDVQAIRNLAASYALARDNHDIETVLSFFAEGATVTRVGQTSQGQGGLRALYETMMGRYDLSIHTPHSHVISVAGDRAIGVQTGTADLVEHGTLLQASFRYSDEYVKKDDRWLFASRVLRFIYCAPVEQLPTSFRDNRRMRWIDEPPAEADLLETEPTWNRFRKP